MNTIFGIPADTLLIILLAVLGLCLLSGLWVLLRHRAVFRMAVRNIPRRPAQTALILIGLMLSTTIIAAALTTGDILDHTVRSDVFDISGYTDEMVVPAASVEDERARPQGGVTFPQTVLDDLQAQVGEDPNIAGMMPVITTSVPAMHPAEDLGEPVLTLVGIDFARIEAFGGLNKVDGSPIDFNALAANQVVLGERPSERLNAAPGDQLTVFVENQPFNLEVAAIAPDTLFTGMHDPGMPGGFAMSLETAQMMMGREGEVSFIAVTNTGGIAEGVERSDEVVATLSEALAGTEYSVVPVKQQALDQAEEVATVFSSLFMVFGMFSIAAGILLIFLIFVLLAAERKPEMGISRAVGMKRRQLTQMFMTEGLAYDLGAALIGAAAGIGVALVMVDLMTSIFGEDTFQLRPTASWRSLLIAYSLGVTVTFITIVVSAWRISRINIVAAVRNLPDPDRKQRQGRGYVLAVGGLVLSLVLLYAGYQALNPFLFHLGVSLVPFALAFVLQRIGAPARLVYSLASLVIVFHWVSPYRFVQGLIPDMPAGDMEMFILSGIMLVTGATMLIMWNASVITLLVATVSRRYSRWVPAVKTAVSYPMASRGRTGLTIAMFSLIIFSLVVMASMSANFTKAIEGEHAGAGWDVQIRQSPTNPITDLPATLADQGYTGAEVVSPARVQVVDAFTSSVRLAGSPEWASYQIGGVDNGFFDNVLANAPVSIKAEGYQTSEEIWEAVRNDPTLAVIDALAIPSPMIFMFGVDFELSDLSIGDTTMDPIDIEIQSRVTDEVRTVTIIGVIDPRVSMLYGIHLNDEAFADIMGQPTALIHYAALPEAADATDAARSMERALMTYGVQADAIDDLLRQSSEQSRGFLYLFEGFMALGLVIGIAALGVISYRAVVERRQQIGMLRAIGYRRSMLAASFVLESTIVTGVGVASGLILGLLLSWQLMQSEVFAGTLAGAGFIVPWGQLLIFASVALGASLLMAWIPARKAAAVPIAESLRYE